MIIPDFLTKIKTPNSKSVTFQVSPFCHVDLGYFVDIITSFSTQYTQNNIRFLFHRPGSTDLHKMLILERRSFYYPPHIHVDREELHFVLSGSLELHFLTHSGCSDHSILCNADTNVFSVVPKGTPHLTRPRSDIVIYLELKNGPHVNFKEECFSPDIGVNLSSMEYMEYLSSKL